MNAKELKMLYKAETSQAPIKVSCDARVGKCGDVILDGNDLDDTFLDMIGRDGQYKWIEIPDVDYVRWLEEKVCELLTNKT